MDDVRNSDTIKIWLAILIGFIGVIFILHPDTGILNFAAIVRLASGIFGSISLVQLRQLTKTTSTQQILFFYFVTGAAITGVMLPSLWQTPTLKIWLLLLGVGFFSAFLDWLIWNTIPNAFTMIGMILFIIGGISAIYFGKAITRQSK